MTAAKDILIVGGGIAGLSLARALRLRGLDPLVIDGSPAPPRQATARSAWMIRTDSEDPEIAALAEAGGVAWRSGRLGQFRASGCFLVGRGERDDVAEHVEAARGRGEWRSQDGIVEPSSALLALRPPPGRFVGGFPVDELRRERGGIVARGPRGELHAAIVVNAAGSRAAAIGRLPLRALKRHLVISSCRQVPAGAPFVWDVREHFYFRPHELGLMMCACDEIESLPGDHAIDPAAIACVVRTAERLQPGLGEHRVLAAWAGQRVFAADGRFVAGWDRREPGLFHLAALGGHGITVAPALAELAAEAIMRGPEAMPEPGLAPWDPMRLIPD